MKSLKLGWGPVGADLEVVRAERELLHPLFVDLRDRRMLLTAPVARKDGFYVRRSVGEIRDALTSTLGALGPDSVARPWIERLRSACRAYLDADAELERNAPTPTYLLALDEMLEAFRVVAEHVAALYRLPEAQELATEIRKAQTSLRD